MRALCVVFVVAFAVTPASAAPPAFVASLVDGSALRVTLLDETVEFSTPHGPLRVAIRDLRRLDLAVRIPDEIGKRITAAVADLGNSDYRRREAATPILLGEGERGLSALREAEKSPDP